MSVRNAATYALAALAVLLVIFALDLVLLFFAAIIIAVMLSALANALSRRTRIARWMSLALVILAIAIGITLIAWLAAPAIYAELRELRTLLPEALTRVQELMKRFVWLETILNALPSGERMDRPGVGGRLFTGAFTVLVNVFIVLVVSIYLAATPRVYVEGAVRLFPLRHRPRAQEVLDQMYETMKGWLLGMLISMTLVGLLMFIGLWALGIPLAGTLGLLAGVLEFIPFLGPWLGGAPAVLLALTISTRHVLYALALVLLVQAAESYLITPLVMKRVIKIPPALTITALVVGSLTAGWLGLLLATPALAMIMVLVRMVYIESVLGDTSEPIDADTHAKAADRSSAPRNG